MIGNIIQTQYVQNANYPVGLGAGADPDGGAARRRCTSTRGPSAPARSRSTCDRRRPRRRGILGVRAAAAHAGRGSSCPATSVLVILYTLVPIGVMILYGFNQAPSGRLTFAWKGFTLDWYRHLFDIPDLTTALVHSLEIAALSTLIATALGTPAALALARYRFRGRGAGRPRDPRRRRRALGRRRRLAARLLRLPRRPARLRHDPDRPRRLQRRLRRRRPPGAARATSTSRWSRRRSDLGANPWIAFWKVTFPLIFPGILAAALLAFALSIDDFIITSFVAGQTLTFPLWVYGAVKVGHPAAGVRDGDADLRGRRGAGRDRPDRAALAAGRGCVSLDSSQSAWTVRGPRSWRAPGSGPGSAGRSRSACRCCSP